MLILLIYDVADTSEWQTACNWYYMKYDSFFDGLTSSCPRVHYSEWLMDMAEKVSRSKAKRLNAKSKRLRLEVEVQRKKKLLISAEGEGHVV